ncbi:WD40 repeat-like protein [Imleria badia]|nr:WD40 repeat-like protein [Imleria badia]
MSSVTPSQRSEAKRPDPHRVISAPNSDIRMLAYHPDGRRVVSRSGEGTIRVWNLENGQQEGTSMEHSSGSVGNLAVTRDGTRIISCDENGIKVWDIESQEIIQEWTHREGSSKFPIFSNGLVAASHRSSVFIYTIEGRQVYLSIKVGKFVWSMSFSPSGDKLACGTRSDIYVYDVVNGTLLLGPLQGHTEAVDYVLWSHDGSRLFSASRNDNTIRCWNSDTGEHIGEPWKHGNYSLSISLSPDGSKLASTSGGDKTISFWDTFSGSPITQHLQHDGGHFVYAASFSPSGEYLVSAGCCGKIYLWRVPWLEPVDSQQASHAANLNSILPDLSLAPDERQRIFELRMRKLVRVSIHCMYIIIIRPL